MPSLFSPAAEPASSTGLGAVSEYCAIGRQYIHEGSNLLKRPALTGKLQRKIAYKLFIYGLTCPYLLIPHIRPAETCYTSSIIELWHKLVRWCLVMVYTNKAALFWKTTPTPCLRSIKTTFPVNHSKASSIRITDHSMVVYLIASALCLLYACLECNNTTKTIKAC